MAPGGVISLPLEVRSGRFRPEVNAALLILGLQNSLRLLRSVPVLERRVFVKLGVTVAERPVAPLVMPLPLAPAKIRSSVAIAWGDVPAGERVTVGGRAGTDVSKEKDVGGEVDRGKRAALVAGRPAGLIVEHLTGRTWRELFRGLGQKREKVSQQESL